MYHRIIVFFFVCLVGGLIEENAYSTLNFLESLPVTNWQQPYSWTCRYMNSRVSITLVGVVRQFICGSQLPTSRISVQNPQYEDGVRLHLYRLKTIKLEMFLQKKTSMPFKL